MVTKGVKYTDAQREFEKKFIAHVLSQSDGNLGKAAEVLGIHRNTLTRKITEYRLKRLTLEIYGRGVAHAESKGIIIADTKFEFGLAPASPNSSRRSAGGAKADANEIVLIDEVLTPDSSRFWPRDQYEPGHGQPSFDKQYVRDYLEEIRWNKRPPVPSLPEDVVMRTRQKYIEAYQRLTGKELA